MEKNTLPCDAVEGLFDKKEQYISILYDLLLPDAIDTQLITGNLPEEFENNGEYLFLIERGEFDILRTKDDVFVASGSGPAIAGLHRLFIQFSCHYIHFTIPSVVHFIPLEAVRKKIDSADAWRLVTGIPACEIKYSLTRDINSVTHETR